VRTILLVQLAASVVGMLDGARSEAWDQVGIFALIAVLAFVLLLRTTGRRPLVPVRGDLERWLAARAAMTGERVEDVTDRALAAYRAGIVGDEDTDAPSGA
jgi:hypothetical protein